MNVLLLLSLWLVLWLVLCFKLWFVLWLLLIVLICVSIHLSIIRAWGKRTWQATCCPARRGIIILLISVCVCVCYARIVLLVLLVIRMWWCILLQLAVLRGTALMSHYTQPWVEITEHTWRWRATTGGARNAHLCVHTMTITRIATMLLSLVILWLVFVSSISVSVQ